MEKLKKWTKASLEKDEENLTNLQLKETKALDKVKKSYKKSKEKATAKVAVGRMDKIKKEVETMVAAWEPGDTEKGNDADSMKKLFLQAMLKEIGALLEKQPVDKVAEEEVETTAVEVVKKQETKKVAEPEKKADSTKDETTTKEKTTPEVTEVETEKKDEITTLFQLLHAENRKLMWK
jgi:cell division septation protein DedD